MSYSHEPQHQGSYPQPQQGAQQTQGQAQPQIYAQQPQGGGQYPQQLQQPPVQQPMMVAVPANFGHGTHQNVMGKPLDAQGKRDWNHGLCSCTDRCGTCCLACWCPCVVYGEIATKIEALQTTGQPHPDGGDSCGVPTWLFCLVNYVTGCAWVMTCFQTGSVRRRYNIKGNGCVDCLKAGFCNPCVETQMIREIEDEENVLIGKAPQGQQQMQVPQQQQQHQQIQQPQPAYHGEKTPAYQQNGQHQV